VEKICSSRTGELKLSLLVIVQARRESSISVIGVGILGTGTTVEGDAGGDILFDNGESSGSIDLLGDSGGDAGGYVWPIQQCYQVGLSVFIQFV